MFDWINLLICTWKHPSLKTKVRVDELRLYDTLLYHGHTTLNSIIQSCTESFYNHAGLYVGLGRVLHAIGSGFKPQKIEDAISSSDKIIHVYRHKNQFSFAEVDRMNEVANMYINNKTKYDVNALVMLSKVTALRKNATEKQRKRIDKNWKNILDKVNSGEEKLDCSEAVYRIYKEGGHPFGIMPDVYVPQFKTKNFEDRNKAKESCDIKIVDFVPDFITPADIEMSPDLVLVGELIKP